MAFPADNIEDDDNPLLNDVRQIANQLEKIIDEALSKKLYKKEIHRGETLFVIDTSSIFDKIDEDIFRGLDEQLNEFELRRFTLDKLKEKYFKVGWKKMGLSTDLKGVSLKK